jgi:hypothetical protein
MPWIRPTVIGLILLLFAGTYCASFLQHLLTSADVVPGRPIGCILKLSLILVGTSRCDVPARAERAERIANVLAGNCAAGRGADDAAETVSKVFLWDAGEGKGETGWADSTKRRRQGQ